MRFPCIFLGSIFQGRICLGIFFLLNGVKPFKKDQSGSSPRPAGPPGTDGRKKLGKALLYQLFLSVGRKKLGKALFYLCVPYVFLIS